jgi:NAD+ kinase
MAIDPLKLIVLPRDQTARVQKVWRELSAFLGEQSGVEVVATAVTEEFSLGKRKADLVVTLGGDGAILRACRQLGRRQIPIIGVNLGRFGFLADLLPDEFRENFDVLRARNYRIVEHLMFECEHRKKDGSSETYLGLNEVAILAGASLRMIDINLAIDGERVTTYSCDGLIVSTPVGSTAHSLSAGGPILKQNLEAFVITPICPHALTNRPIVEDAKCVYTLGLPTVPKGVRLVIDGQIKLPLAEGDTVVVRRADVTFKLAKIAGHSYYAALHRKLGWTGQPVYRVD